MAARVFAFTDDLDATNRLFDFLRDAEGMDIFGRPASNREPLAALRGSSQPDRQLRAELGQDWTQLGEGCAGPLTQQVDHRPHVLPGPGGCCTEAEVIVATAALEVGFNDRKVGSGRAAQGSPPTGQLRSAQEAGREDLRKCDRGRLPYCLTLAGTG